MKKFFTVMALATVLAACQESLEERAAREAREITETKCPMPVGDNLIMDSVVFDIPSMTQSQYFHVVGELDNDTLFKDIDSRGLLLGELKNTPSYKALMERNVDFHYVYRSTKDPDAILLELTLTAEDYK